MKYKGNNSKCRGKGLKYNSAKPRRWMQWGAWQAAWLMTSTIC